MMYTRPLQISDEKSLDECVNNGKFDKEAHLAIEAAAHLAQGELLGKEKSQIPTWELDKKISEKSCFYYR